MYQFISLHPCDYVCEILLKANVANDESNDRNETKTLNKEMILD